MINRLLLCSLAIAGFVLGPGATPAAAKKWVVLGETNVSHGADRDVIVVTAREGTFSKIRLRVKEADVRILDMKIQFADGDIQDVKVRELVPAGKKTRSIDLHGRNRVIRKVEFLYTTPNRETAKALIQLEGRR